MNAQATIVVLEDERPQLLLLQASLHEAGEVAAFSDPVAALDFLKNHPVDVALIDIGLGAHAKMDGLEFIRAVREFDDDLCIIIRTGNDTAEVADQAIELGAFRRSLKTKQPVDELRKLTKAAIEETRNRRRMSRDAASSAEIRGELGEALGTMDEEQSLGDSYRVFLQTLRNRVTSVAGMAELMCREAATPRGREHAIRNRELVAGLVSELATFLDAPLTNSQVGADQTGGTTNGILEAMRRRFALSADSAKDGRILKVSGLREDLVVAVPALRLVAALRHIVEFCWGRSAPGSTTLLSAWCCNRVQQELDAIRENKLVFSRSPAGFPRLAVAFRITCDLLDTSVAQIRCAIEEYSENPRNGCLHTVSRFIDATRSVLVVHQRSSGPTVFDLYVPVEMGR
ncbi:MAG: response regulator [Opitutus sp.]